MSDARPPDIRDRTFEFSSRVIDFCAALSTASFIERHLAGQLIRSGTSVGANLEEAKSAHSRRDFSAKTAIALRECRESLYWLRLLDAKSIGPEPTRRWLLGEANELVAILTTIVRRVQAA